MKSTLSSTFTQQKALVFCLWTLVNIGKIKGETVFKWCLNSIGNYTSLISSIDNDKNSPSNGTFCCNSYYNRSSSLSCSPLIADQNYNFTSFCPNSLAHTSFGRCLKLDSSYFCVSYSSAFSSPIGGDLGNNILCGGILGNNSITTNNTWGDCSSFINIDNIAQALTQVTSNFVALCCNNRTPENSTAYLFCYQGALDRAQYGNILSTTTTCYKNVTSPYSLMCFQDNGGWICTGSYGNEINLYPLGYIANGTYSYNASDGYSSFPFTNTNFTYIGNCNLQVKLPLIISSVNNKDNQLIIIGSGIGGGSLVITSTVAGYYIYKRRKKIENKDWENETNLTSHSKNTGNQTLIADFIGKLEKAGGENEDLQIQLINVQERLVRFTESQEIISKQIAEKKFELKELKKSCLEKGGNYDREKLNEELEEILEARNKKNDQVIKWIKKNLLKETLLTSIELDNFCQKKGELVDLELQLGNMQDNIRITKERITVINNNYQITQGAVLNTGTINQFNNSNLTATEMDFSHQKTVNYQQEMTPKHNTNWTNIHHDFTNQQLINTWLTNNFTFEEVREWNNAFNNKFEPNNCAFYVWLRDIKQVTAEWCLNNGNLEQLQTEYKPQQLQNHIEQPPK